MSPLRLALVALLFVTVTLNWRDNSDNETGFRIYRASNGPTGDFIVIGTASANSTAYEDTNVTSGQTYSYKVQAFNAGGGSAFSTVATTTAIPSTSTPPNGPSNLSVTVNMPGRLVNVSDRGLVAVDGAVKITGFAVADGPVKVLVRAVGPTIAAAPYNVAGTLADPKLWVKNAAGTTIAQNDNWSGADVSAAAQASGAFALPAGSKDAAIVITLQPGTYTAHVSGQLDTDSGVVLLEVYEVPTP